MERERVIKMAHNEAIGGHMGGKKVWERLKRDFYWPNMLQDCKDWVRRCEVCQRTKASRQAKLGKMIPLAILKAI